MSPAGVAGFLPIALVLALIPGPSVLFTVGRALSAGRGAALRTVLGNATGVLVQVGAVALGLGLVITAAPWAQTAIRIGGGLYLLWLGVQAIRERRSTPHADQTRRGASDLATGFLVGISNPKTIVFFAALLPAFVRPGWPAGLQILILGALFVAFAVIGDTCWALGAAQARQWFAGSPTRLEGLRAFGGVVLLGLGVYTLIWGGS